MLQVPAKTQKINIFGSKSALPLRGGNWHEAGRAGVFALNLNNPRVNSWDNVGFRAASPFLPDTRSSRAPGQSGEVKGACFHAQAKNRNLWKPPVAESIR